MAFYLPIVCLLVVAQPGPATVPLRGVVVDSDAKPVADADVGLENMPDRFTDKILVRTRTDAEGRFSLDRLADATGGGTGRPMFLWVRKQGERIGHKSFGGALPGPDEPVRITIGPKAGAEVRVIGPDQAGIPNALVRLKGTHCFAAQPPENLIESITAKTNALGIATLDGIMSEDIQWIEIQADGFGRQFVRFEKPVPGLLTVRLEPGGTLAGKLVAHDPPPNALAGWTVTAKIFRDNEHIYSTFEQELITDADGRFRAGDLPSGELWLEFKEPERSAYRAPEMHDLAIQRGRVTKVEVPIRRGVLLKGSVIEEETGTPVAGVPVSVKGDSFVEAIEEPVTDEKGQYSCYILPGWIQYSLSSFSNSYFLRPTVGGKINLTLHENETQHTLPPISTSPAAAVRGIVLDEADKPLAGIFVHGAWNTKDVIERFSTNRPITNAKGEFVLGSIPPGSEMRVSANLWSRMTVFFVPGQTVSVTERDNPPLTLRLLHNESTSLRGRVLDHHGQPLKDVLIQVYAAESGNRGALAELFRFKDEPMIRTNSQGVFQTPKELPVDLEYQIEAMALGTDRGKTDWIVPPDYKTPDSVLQPAKNECTVAGRVVDRQGAPVIDAVVFQTGDGPYRIEVRTDRDGRFTAPGMPSGSAFLFVRKEGFRFQGIRVGANDNSVQIVVNRTTEPGTPLPRLKERVTRDEDRALAKKVLEPISAGLLDSPRDLVHSYAVEAVARIDPQKTFDQIANQIFLQDQGPAFSNAVLAVFENDPAAAIAAVEAINEPSRAAFTYIELFDITNDADRPRQLDLLARSLVEARKILDPVPRVTYLSRVGERYLDIAETELGTIAIREAEAIVRRLPQDGSEYSRIDFVPALARISLPEALAFPAEKHDRDPFDPQKPEPLNGKIFDAVAASHPLEASRLISEWKVALGSAGPSQCVYCAIAAKDLPKARELAMGVSNPAARASLLAWMALVRSNLDREGSRTLLAEAYDQLELVSESPQFEQLSLENAFHKRTVLDELDRIRSFEGDSLSDNVAGRMASLLAVAERVDPDRVSEYFWRALAARGPIPKEPEDYWFSAAASVAVLISRYDRESAQLVLAPIRERLPKWLANLADWQSFTTAWRFFPTTAALDPQFAIALIDLQPKQKPYRFSHKYTQTRARIEIARILVLPPTERWREVLKLNQLLDPVDRRNRHPNFDDEISFTDQDWEE